jgi:hypothetical protein
VVIAACLCRVCFPPTLQTLHHQAM